LKRFGPSDQAAGYQVKAIGRAIKASELIAPRQKPTTGSVLKTPKYPEARIARIMGGAEIGVGSVRHEERRSAQSEKF